MGSMRFGHAYCGSLARRLETISRFTAVSSMLFKELVPIVVSILLLAPLCKGKVFAVALDNAGVAFVLNSMSCRCPLSLALLRPLADVLAKHHIGLVVGHTHRHHNTHADKLSHALPQAMWDSICAEAPSTNLTRLHFPFVVHDIQANEAFAASMSLPRAITGGVRVAR